MVRAHQAVRPPFRARLALEALEWRDQPSALSEGGTASSTSPDYEVPALGAENAAPQIVDFLASEMGNGYFVITGRVVDETPGGLTVTFGGAVLQLAGKTAVTAEDGTFSISVRIKTDGTEGGTVSAVVSDGQSTSEEALVTLSATSAP